ncbi:hypothetical protein F5Y03DRAFT_385039 [Xylaria venustula]|nr:hypothetical protein F5Y03DRAFT_385039 [Xylaria venustula]
MASQIELITRFPKETPRAIAHRVRNLLKLQAQQPDLIKKHQNTVAELEAEHNSQCAELYTKRAEIINVPRGSIQINTDNTPLAASALKNNPFVGREITEEDETVLVYLRDIRVRLEGHSFQLRFDFDDNPDPEDYTGDLIYGQAIGDSISWREGWNLKRMLFADEDGNDKSEQPLDNVSFFDLFDTLAEPDSSISAQSSDNGEREDDEGDEEASEHEDEYEENLTWHFEMGKEIKDRVVPYAVHWYIGEVRLFEDTDSEAESGDDEESDE